MIALASCPTSHKAPCAAQKREKQVSKRECEMFAQLAFPGVGATFYLDTENESSVGE